MKRSLTFLSAFILLMFGAFQSSFAQDDVYYDPKNDPGNNTSTEQKYDNGTTNEESNATNNSNYTGSTDKTDGYGNPADKYDPRDNYNSSTYDNSQYATDAGYYDEDYDSYFYTTRLRRYYVPNYGADYYSYWYTPSYFIGINTWNTAYVVSYSPWYQDPWWSWNRRFYQPAVVMYDPFWSWNFGWNTCAYYNSWSNPYYGGYSSWGYNGWGYNNGGFCGGYYNGYNQGYNNGYWNGYYDGYNNGYYNGYGNSAYNNNYYYHGPRHHRDAVADNTVRTPVSNPTTGGNVRPTDIPRQGITTPRNPGVSNGAGTDNGVKVIAGTARPYSEVRGTGNNTDRGGVKPSDQVGGLQNTAGNRPEEKPVRANTPGVNMPSSNSNSADPDKIGRNGQPPAGSSWPFVQQKDPADWHEAPPTRWSNGQPAQPATRGNNQPVQQPNRDNYNSTPNRSGAYGEQQRSSTPQNNNRVEPRTYEQPRVATPNAQPQRTEPRSNYQPRTAEQPQRVSPPSAPQRESRPQMSQPQRSEPRNFSAPQQQPQRNFSSPGPSNYGGGMKPGRR